MAGGAHARIIVPGARDGSLLARETNAAPGDGADRARAMSLLSLVLLAFALSIDAFAASIARGLCWRLAVCRWRRSR